MIEARRLIAYHEAGHAVARLFCGNPVRRVTIAEDGTGNTKYLYRSPRPLADAVCCVAGPLVESAIAERPLAEVFADDTGRADLEMAEAALRADPEGRDLKTAVRLAARIIKEYAGTVEAVAEALIASGALDEAELRRITEPPSPQPQAGETAAGG
jgi:ATP-dependent Zn protease